MRVVLHLRIVGDDDTVLSDAAVLRLERADHRLAAVGLSLADAKTLLADIQNHLVVAQASDYVARQRSCPACGRRRPIKGYETIAFRTAFGLVRLPSPRLVHCRCQATARKTFSPLTALFTEHTAPELRTWRSCCPPWRPGCRRSVPCPANSWSKVARALGRLGSPDRAWTADRLSRAVHRLVAEGLVEPAPRKPPKDDILLVIAGIKGADAALSLRAWRRCASALRVAAPAGRRPP